MHAVMRWRCRPCTTVLEPNAVGTTAAVITLGSITDRQVTIPDGLSSSSSAGGRINGVVVTGSLRRHWTYVTAEKS